MGAVKGCESAADEQAIPQGAVLIEEKDRLSARVDAGAGTGRLNFHQGNEAVDFGLVRRELGEDPPQPQRVFAQPGSEPFIAGRRGISLVEDQVDHLEH